MFRKRHNRRAILIGPDGVWQKDREFPRKIFNRIRCRADIGRRAAVCFALVVSSIGGNLALSVTGLQLQLVQLLTGAINAGAAAAATSQPVTGAIAGCPTINGVDQRQSQVPQVDQPLTYRAVDAQLTRSAVTYDRRGVPDAHGRRCTDVPPPPPKAVTQTGTAPAFQPPWRTLPWPAGSPRIKVVRRIVKTAPGRADVRDVGQTLDLFI